jgi:hypothetical protein
MLINGLIAEGLVYEGARLVTTAAILTFCMRVVGTNHLANEQTKTWTRTATHPFQPQLAHPIGDPVHGSPCDA